MKLSLFILLGFVRGGDSLVTRAWFGAQRVSSLAGVRSNFEPGGAQGGFGGGSKTVAAKGIGSGPKAMKAQNEVSFTADCSALYKIISFRL